MKNKKKDYVRLFTPSGERLHNDPAVQPWNAYPRPQMRRDSFLCLNGFWELAISEGDVLPTSFPRRVRVPYPVESLLSEIGETVSADSRLYYRRSFSLPDGFVRDRVLLHIGAADQHCRVWINGVAVGGHSGGYDPIVLDVTPYLQAENTLLIGVWDTLDSHILPYGKQRRDGGGMWYTPVTGIWQTVWVESVPETYVKGLTITTIGNAATVRVDGASDGVITVTTPAGEQTATLSDGLAEIVVENPRLWCPEDPYLYEFVLQCGTDRVESYFALRTLSTQRVDGVPRLCLNGKPVFFHAVLDQGYWSDGLFLPPLPTCYAWDVEKMQELGFNTLRKHIKIEPEQFYYDCDRLGMLVWQDMVNNGDYSFLRDTALPTLGFKRLSDRRMHRDSATRAAFEESMERTVAQLGNHPCIVGWTIFNEGWGQFDSQRMYEKLRSLDASRFIDTASGWFGGADSDVVSEHVYFKPYRFQAADKPVFLSEFGGYSYKPEGHVFNVGKTYGYRFFAEQAAFEEALERLYREEIIPAAKRGLCGAVYTQLSDVEDETNGLYSYDRRVCKVTPSRMQAIAEELKEAVR